MQFTNKENTLKHVPSRPLVYEDQLSIVTTVGCSMGHLSDTNAPLYKDHLSTKTAVGSSIVHLSDTRAPLYIDHLSTKTAMT